MRRISNLLLEIALFVASITALGYLVRMIVAWFLPVQWYWGGAMAAIAAPVLVALALFVSARVPATGTTHA
ncbi:hypothetical protein KCP91_01990 [Microvirga sp. SRT01]|uniref:Uncharacterized protein n=1 Tax=Sphingomonas longa TaxID=2778730 RepID=A0ABS2D4T2_9SPHN|nr:MULTISPECIES: hypothetical protein [Alphaproteobacteria]MBM6575129.1 hypothetical protein [Sphingomonas sp. BT552]MBR7708180.1 hypothetical protein [Microvirga sp. SRT01]